MNGRVYEPSLGRFLSPDPLVSDPSNSQTFNRYSYVRNNPLSYTDPSGFLEEVVVYAERSGGCSAGATCYSGGSFSFFDASAAAMHDLSNMAVGGLFDAVSNAVERVEFSALAVEAGIGMLTEQEDTDAPLDDPKDQEARKAENKQKQKDALNAKAGDSSGGAPGGPDGDGDGKKSKDSSKNEKHGDRGRAKTKSEKLIQKLEEQKKSASGREKKQINQRIKNINRDAARKAKGEEHSRTKKR